jgi:hypothetical protein
MSIVREHGMDIWPFCLKACAAPATIQAALEAGITLLDTGDFYGMGHNELVTLIAGGEFQGEPSPP